MTATIRAYKDTLFRRLFGDEREKANALSLYNALAGTSHEDPDELELTTVEGVLYMGFKNDVSFLVDSQLVLWEQQGTPNPNMPLRGLIYFGQLYTSAGTASTCTAGASSGSPRHVTACSTSESRTPPTRRR